MKDKILLTLLTLSVGLFFYDQFFIDKGETINHSIVSGEEVGIQPGKKAADFTLSTIDGKEIALSDFNGKVVFINFWASWCPPCRAEMPHIQDFYKKYKDQDFIVLSVNLTHLETGMGNVEKFINKNELTFPVVYDERGVVDDIYKVNTIPTSIVVDREGVIRYRIVGPISKERLISIYQDI